MVVYNIVIATYFICGYLFACLINGQWTLTNQQSKEERTHKQKIKQGNYYYHLNN